MAPFEDARPGFTLLHHVLQRADAMLAREEDLAGSLSYDRRQRILMIISISLASVSVLAAFTAFYWFVRMRRSFRQDLIMLLIQSDMMKAMWLVLCPLVYFSTGSLDNEYYFCQVSGFLLTAAIEATDIAVLMIAIHQALYVINPNGGGLYPYRRIAYIIWAIGPLILAAVVPMTGNHFDANGPNCYLPVDPSWYRQAVSWGPRYGVFVLISLLYAFVYLYVGLRFRRFGKEQRSTSMVSPYSADQLRIPDPLAVKPKGVPPTPSINDHGLLDSEQGSINNEVGKVAEHRQHSIASTASTKVAGERQLPAKRPPRPRPETIPWNMNSFNIQEALSAAQTANATDVDSTHRTDENDTIEPARPPPALLRGATSPPSVTFQREQTLLALTRPLSAPVVSDDAAVPPHWRRTAASMSPREGDVIHLSADATNEMMKRSRERTHRQLRLLVVYPVIYVISWVAPFVSHVLGYDDNVSELNSGPMELQVLSIASFCIGAAVDCCFFMGWEKPWHYLQGGFWEGLFLRLGSVGRFFRHTDRFRPHFQRDARHAHIRRAQEDLDRGVLAATVPKAKTRKPREWWDDPEDANEVAADLENNRRPFSYHLGATEHRRSAEI